MGEPFTETSQPYAAAGTGDSYGASPEVNPSSMTAVNRVVGSVDAAVNLTETDIQDARKLIIVARRITAKKQGAPPYSPAQLKQQGKSWKRNASTRFLQKELARAAPRFYMPVLTASTVTAAQLPMGWPGWQEKTAFFRETITRRLRGWRKWDMFWRGLGAEVVDYGFGFAAFTDPNEWRPHLARMDRGFVPRGTEVMDDKLQRFTLKWDYTPDVLLSIVRKATDSGSQRWNKDAVAAAIDAAGLPALPQDYSQLRKWEELIRENSWDYNYTRSTKVIECRHLYVVEFSGKVSHYILWPGGPKQYQLLYEHLDAYDSTDDVVIPVTFGYGDGTIHGSWGAGQLLYDLAAQVEKIRNDSIDNLLNSNKVKIQVPSAKDAATAQLVVNDTMVILTGGQFAQNTGGVAANPEGYMVLEGKMAQWAQEIVGDYLPPIPLQPSDIKAAQVNAAIAREQEAQRDVLESWMKQVALIVGAMVKRMMNPETDDEYALETQRILRGEVSANTPPPPVSLTNEEIALFVNQPVVQSVTDFTEYAASQRAAFCASVMGNQLFNQSALAKYMAGGVPGGGQAFVDAVVVPEGDTTSITAQQRQQEMENATMLVLGKPMPVVVTDNHWIHFNVVVPPLEQAIMGGAIQAAEAGLAHASAHYAAGVGQKTWPPEKINESKATIGRLQRALEQKKLEVAEVQQMQGGQPQLQAI